MKVDLNFLFIKKCLFVICILASDVWKNPDWLIDYSNCQRIDFVLRTVNISFICQYAFTRLVKLRNLSMFEHDWTAESLGFKTVHVAEFTIATHK